MCLVRASVESRRARFGCGVGYCCESSTPAEEVPYIDTSLFLAAATTTVQSKLRKVHPVHFFHHCHQVLRATELDRRAQAQCRAHFS